MRGSIGDVLSGRASWCVALGDCLQVLPMLPDGSVSHVITDPPYEAEAHTKGRRIKTTGNGGSYGTVGGCVIDFAPITPEQRAGVSLEFARLSRRWSIVFCQVEAVPEWRNVLVSAGATYRRACVWLKDDAQPQLSGDRPGMGYETIVCAHAPGRSRWNGGGKRGVYNSARASTIERRPALHMTEKPLPVISQLVEDFTDPDEIVLDPFAGSGTTGVACLRLGRRFIGIEKDERYWQIAVDRLTAEGQGQSLREFRAGQLPMFAEASK